MTTPWTDKAIAAVGSPALDVHPTIWNELRRIEGAHKALVAALQSAQYALKSSGYDMDNAAPTGTNEMLGDQIDAALAKAEGRS